jgi:hypothetical protein
MLSKAELDVCSSSDLAVSGGTIDTPAPALGSVSEPS